MAVRDVVQAAAGALGGDKLYVEDVFSTYLYTGNGSTQTITNGIDLDGEGGLVWLKSRSAAGSNWLTDTARGVGNELRTNTTNAQGAFGFLSAFNSNGFTDAGQFSGASVASWTFRKAPKFFDVVTYQGNGLNNHQISHNLGSVPGCIIVKRINASTNWRVYHRSLGTSYTLALNNTDPQDGPWTDRFQGVSATTFTVGTDASLNYDYNLYGATYVAYLFAHDAGGFGDDGTDNVISCGSYTGNGSTSGPVVDLGYEPQWLLVKLATNLNATTSSWFLYDNMRGMPTGGSDAALLANTTNAEFTSNGDVVDLTSTGFQLKSSSTNNLNGDTYIYIAIRRGPMKTPTSGTSVFSANTTSAATGTAITTNFPVDLQMLKYRSGAQATMVLDRLRGVSTSTTEAGVFLQTSNTNAEVSDNTVSRYWNNTGYQVASGWTLTNQVNWNFQRAPGFFDEVCYTGNSGSTGGPKQYIPHNLGVAPELYIVKARNLSTDWTVGTSLLTATSGMFLNSTSAAVDNSVTARYWNGYPTSTSLNVGDSGYTNESGYNFVAYLFASCPGVSKVGSYTGTGTTQQINCGFTAGARFVLIKRTDSTGNWYVWDSARGIVSGNDPYLLLNSTVGEATTTDYIDPYSAGFEISSTAPAEINASGGSYIFLAIA